MCRSGRRVSSSTSLSTRMRSCDARVARSSPLDGVSLEVRRGETLGLVGETGCGKSTLARCLTRLYPLTAGTVEFDGHDIPTLSRRELRPYRQRMQLIFQDPFGSLNPRRRVGSIIGDPFAIHGGADGRRACVRCRS